MPSIGTFELFTILIVVLLLFGPAKLPDVGRQIGRAVREVRRVEGAIRSEWSGLLDEQAPTTAPSSQPRNERGDEDAGPEILGRGNGPAAPSRPDLRKSDPQIEPRSSGGPTG
ncbi:MAG: Sec-independent protein translocase subunit TatA/TatB [Acidimicrobiia bacterium]